ncbi:DUF768 domain-containing protein [Mesorhizobium sp. B2-1-3A]|uniref:DUF768 domain-containing protein n=1 Tax=Mesorhizobium sp. B2-1-3A TaxID=2589971 RepID=UPI001129D3BC|nr:DUF768 domain-containing protein [Mesorhizobium sp. B2-1-3A]TPM94918.1 DUF768 domain-containing protein [Mesorhizobium sp. B2-1-3A]
MSSRGIDFLDKWMAEQLPENVTDDPVLISDLADCAMRAADKAGIPIGEISEEVRSVFEVIAEALDHREGGTP